MYILRVSPRDRPRCRPEPGRNIGPDIGLWFGLRGPRHRRDYRDWLADNRLSLIVYQGHRRHWHGREYCPGRGRCIINRRRSLCGHHKRAARLTRGDHLAQIDFLTRVNNVRRTNAINRRDTAKIKTVAKGNGIKCIPLVHAVDQFQ